MKRILLIIVIVSLLSLMVGCGGSDKNAKFVQDNDIKLVNINGLISYDKDTKIIYYYFKDVGGAGYSQVGYGFMSPYISENGKFCRYDTNENKIIELK